MDENYEKRGYLLEDFRLFHLKDDRGTKVDYHYHEFCKIVLLLSGSGSYIVEGRRYLLLPGDVVLVGSRCVHKPEFEEGISYERVILYISPALLAESSVPDYSLEDIFSGQRGHVLRPTEDVRRRLRSLAEQLESEMAASGGENVILSRCTLLRLLVVPHDAPIPRGDRHLHPQLSLRQAASGGARSYFLRNRSHRRLLPLWLSQLFRFFPCLRKALWGNADRTHCSDAPIGRL